MTVSAFKGHVPQDACSQEFTVLPRNPCSDLWRQLGFSSGPGKPVAHQNRMCQSKDGKKMQGGNWVLWIWICQKACHFLSYRFVWGSWAVSSRIWVSISSWIKQSGWANNLQEHFGSKSIWLDMIKIYMITVDAVHQLWGTFPQSRGQMGNSILAFSVHSFCWTRGRLQRCLDVGTV